MSEVEPNLSVVSWPIGAGGTCPHVDQGYRGRSTGAGKRYVLSPEERQGIINSLTSLRQSGSSPGTGWPRPAGRMLVGLSDEDSNQEPTKDVATRRGTIIPMSNRFTAPSTYVGDGTSPRHEMVILRPCEPMGSGVLVEIETSHGIARLPSREPVMISPVGAILVLQIPPMSTAVIALVPNLTTCGGVDRSPDRRPDIGGTEELSIDPEPDPFVLLWGGPEVVILQVKFPNIPVGEVSVVFTSIEQVKPLRDTKVFDFIPSKLNPVIPVVPQVDRLNLIAACVLQIEVLYIRVAASSIYR
jgi:hypothetical protein